MADQVNELKVAGTLKWEPRVFEPKEDGQKTIFTFAIEWVRPKSDKKSVFNVKAFGKLADELVSEKLDQGDEVTITGSLNETRWKDKKTDEWVNRVEIWANKVEVVGRAGGSAPDTSDFVAVGGAVDDDSDIPF